MLHCNSNCFGTLGLHAVNLIVILLHCTCPRRFGIVFLDQIRQNDMCYKFFIFFCIYEDHLVDAKLKLCKIKITAKKTSNLRYFMNVFSINKHCLQYRLSHILVI